MDGITEEDLVALYESGPDPPPLEGLGSVDWSAVRDAYGPATSTPALLRALTSAVTGHREAALRLLFTTVWHQGSVYPASAAAVPFLYNLLEADGPHDKREVASLIVTIAEGEPPAVGPSSARKRRPRGMAT